MAENFETKLIGAVWLRMKLRGVGHSAVWNLVVLALKMELELSWQRSGVQQAYHAKVELVHSVS